MPSFATYCARIWWHRQTIQNTHKHIHTYTHSLSLSRCYYLSLIVTILVFFKIILMNIKESGSKNIFRTKDKVIIIGWKKWEQKPFFFFFLAQIFIFSRSDVDYLVTKRIRWSWNFNFEKKNKYVFFVSENI